MVVSFLVAIQRRSEVSAAFAYAELNEILKAG